MCISNVVSNITYWTVAVVIGIITIQTVRLFYADGDLTLLFKEKFGKRPACLAGQVVWITGASSGIGEYLAYELVRAGCKLILSARRTQELERVKQQCLALRLTDNLQEEDLFVLPLDVTEYNTHAQAVQEALCKFEKIDILVNNAGRSQRALIKNTELEVDMELMKVNYIGVVSLTKALLPHMRENKHGHIVVTSSIAGKIAGSISASYSASKFALHGWFETARVELEKDNIDITIICPGPVFSDVQKNAFTHTLSKTYGVDMKKTERRMETDRCAQLISVAIANKLPEVWIALHPVLLLIYLTQFMPRRARSSTHQ